MRSIPLFRRLPEDSKVRIREHVPDSVLRRVRPNHTKMLPAGDHKPQSVGAPLWAVLCTWMEADVIGATVAHLREHGAERVLLVDNDSPDDTAAVAQSAGAELVLSFTTSRFDEAFRFNLINEVIRSESIASGHARIWWAVCDADEFLDGDGEDRALLAGITSAVDERCRVIGARVLDHYPTPGLAYERGTYPLAAQPLYREKVDHRCISGHHKHPVFRWDRDRAPIVVEHGAHQVACSGEQLYEPMGSILMHHFPFRSQADTRGRLEGLARRGLDQPGAKTSANHMRARIASLDAVYGGRFDEVVDYRTGTRGVELRRWGTGSD